ncbi:hypothetical protein PMAYCL1PPCAC_11046, partial [Pristionchus mayeri]
MGTTDAKPELLRVAGRGSCEDHNSKFASVEECNSWYRENNHVNVFFESQEYHTYTESAAYSLSSAIADIG